MAFKFNSNQEAADKKRRRKLTATGTGLGALAFGPGRSALGAAVNVAKAVTGAPTGAGYGLLQSAFSVIKGQDTGGTFGKYFEKGRATTAPADIGGGSTPNIKVQTPANQPNTSGKIIRDTVRSKTPNTNVYNDDLAKQAMKNIGKPNTTVTGLPGKEKIATQIVKDTAKKTGQTILKFPRVGVLDLVGAFAPFLKQAMDAEKRKGQL
tara:strand:- start:1245 stop:1868 length:624 start_codon:yes stop_codon:yes gene_type:complete